MKGVDMEIKKEDLPLYITIQSLADSLKTDIEQAQKFADLSIIKGIIIPVGDGLYKCVSQAVMRRVNELCEAKKQQQKEEEELQRMWKDKLRGE